MVWKQRILIHLWEENTPLTRWQCTRAPVQALILFFQYLGITLEWLMSSFYVMPMATYPFKLSINSVFYTQKKKKLNIFHSVFCLYNSATESKLIWISIILMKYLYDLETRGMYLKENKLWQMFIQVTQRILLLDKHFITWISHQLQIPNTSAKLTILQVYCMYAFLPMTKCRCQSIKLISALRDHKICPLLLIRSPPMLSLEWAWRRPKITSEKSHVPYIPSSV